MPKVVVFVGVGVPFLFLEQMSDRFQRMIQHHPWASKSHHLAYPFPHFLSVAMRRTFLAGGLLLAIFACRKSLVSVFFKLSAIVA